jgi:tetratricopeptide (TPR) repeat protein
LIKILIDEKLYHDAMNEIRLITGNAQLKRLLKGYVYLLIGENALSYETFSNYFNLQSNNQLIFEIGECISSDEFDCMSSTNTLIAKLEDSETNTTGENANNTGENDNFIWCLYKILGDNCYNLDNVDEAISYYSFAIELFEKNNGSQFLSPGRNAETDPIKWIKQWTNITIRDILMTTDLDIYGSRCRMYIANENYEEALLDAEKSIQFYPNSQLSKNRINFLTEKLNEKLKREKFLEKYEEYIKIDISNLPEMVKNNIVCPITKCLFMDPVIAKDGNTYERFAIEEWLNAHSRSPMTNQNIDTEVMPNLSIRHIINSINIPDRR